MEESCRKETDAARLGLYIAPCCDCASSRNVEIPTQSNDTFSIWYKHKSKSVCSTGLSSVSGWKYFTWSSPGNWRKVKLFWILFLLASTVVNVDGMCKVDQCSRRFTSSLDSSGVSRSASAEYCTILRDYDECLKDTARGCRGNLKYHSTSSLVLQMIDNDCANIGSVPPDSEPMFPPYFATDDPEDPLKPEWLDPHDGSQCHVKLFRARPGPMRHCTLFGDPHLKTFTEQSQTCQILGAWPLIDNDYLAVQVSNEPVSDGAIASATTEVTISIHGPHECQLRKTYIAQSSHLPSVFTDGSREGGDGDGGGGEAGIRLIEKAPGRHIEIRVRFLSVTLVVRRVSGGRGGSSPGGYLSVSVLMPDELVATNAHRDDLLELCSRGCPRDQLIDQAAFLAAPSRHIRTLTPHKSELGMPLDAALATCAHSQLTDFYLDSCVFDLLVTGEARFRRAAHTAYRDLVRLQPHAVRGMPNRTSIRADYPPDHLFPVVESCAASIHVVSSRALSGIILSALLLLAVLNCVVVRT